MKLMPESTRGADDADGFLFGDLCEADVIAADADDGNGLSGTAEGTAGDVTRGGEGFLAHGDEGGEGGGGLKEIASLHDLDLLPMRCIPEPDWPLCLPGRPD